VRRDFTVSGYVFFPKGDYKQLQVLLVDGETGNTEVDRAPLEITGLRKPARPYATASPRPSRRGFIRGGISYGSKGKGAIGPRSSRARKC
jgi:hypothetical protein